MKVHGTIYIQGSSGSHGQMLLIGPIVKRLVLQIFRLIGTSLVVFSVLLFSFSYGPIVSQELKYDLKVDNGLVDQKTIVNAATPEEVQNEAQRYGVNSYFSVVIPKINAASPVIANVDVDNKVKYLDALKKGVAHEMGSYFPGQNGTIFLFSHSTDTPANFARFNAVFYLLKKLTPDDVIFVFFADRKYTYKVVDKVITKPTDTSWLSPKENGEELILMTCDPPGTNWNRLLVIAKPGAI